VRFEREKKFESARSQFRHSDPIGHPTPASKGYLVERLVITDIDLNPKAVPPDANLRNGAVGSYIIFGFGLEFLYERRFRTAESPFPL
jgi:hypothetical protein